MAVKDWVEEGTEQAFIESFDGHVHEYLCACGTITPVLFQTGSYECLILEANGGRLVLEVECYACAQKGVFTTSDNTRLTLEAEKRRKPETC
jgi:hypothetical protein